MRPCASRAILLAVLKRWVVPSAKGRVICTTTVAVNGALGTGVTKTLVLPGLISWAWEKAGTVRRAARATEKKAFTALFRSMMKRTSVRLHYSAFEIVGSIKKQGNNKLGIFDESALKGRNRVAQYVDQGGAACAPL